MHGSYAASFSYSSFSRIAKILATQLVHNKCCAAKRDRILGCLHAFERRLRIYQPSLVRSGTAITFQLAKRAPGLQLRTIGLLHMLATASKLADGIRHNRVTGGTEWVKDIFG